MLCTAILAAARPSSDFISASVEILLDYSPQSAAPRDFGIKLVLDKLTFLDRKKKKKVGTRSIIVH